MPPFHKKFPTSRKYDLMSFFIKNPEAMDTLKLVPKIIFKKP